MGVPAATVTEVAPAAAPAPSSPPNICVFVGPSSKGPLATPTSFGAGNITGLASTFGTGTGVKGAAYVAAKTAVQFVFLRVAKTAVAASTSSLDLSGIAGTLVPTVTGTPLDNYEVIVEFTVGGTVGISGIFYRYSLNGGEDYTAATALGTATTITLTDPDADSGTGLTVNLTGAQTVIADDSFTFHTFPASASILPLVTTRADASTANVTASGAPEDAYDGRLEILTGGIIGEAGITYRYSLDGGETWTPETALGTALTLPLVDGPKSTELSGVTLAFEPSSTNDDYIALAVELRADTLAHLANAVAHDGADTSAAQVTLAASSVPATVAAATAVVNLVLAALLSHVVNITSVHDGPDLVAWTALDALAPASTTAEGIDLAIALKAILNTHDAVALAADDDGLMGATTSIASPTTYTAAAHFLAGGVAALDAQPRRLRFVIDGGGTPANMADSVTITGFDYAGNAQTETALSLTGLGTIDSVKAWKGTGLSCAFVAADGTAATFTIGYAKGGHNSADVTNTVTADDPTYGTLDAGDVVTFKTTAPQCQAADVNTALDALRASSLKWSFLHVIGDATASSAGTLGSKLATWAATTKFSFACANVRDEGTREGETTWVTRQLAAFASFADNRIAVGAGYATVTCPINARRNRRPGMWPVVANLVNRDIHIDPAQKNLGPLSSDVTLHDADQLLVEHDARLVPALHDARFVTLRSFDDETGVFVTLGNLMGATNDIQLITYRRVMNLAEELYQKVMTAQLVSKFRFFKTDRANGTYRKGDVYEPDALQIEKQIVAALDANIVQRGYASGVRVTLNRTPVLLSLGKYKLTADVKIVGLGYIVEFAGSIGFTDPQLDALLNAA
jgi:hypothetical protein